MRHLLDAQRAYLARCRSGVVTTYHEYCEIGDVTRLLDTCTFLSIIAGSRELCSVTAKLCADSTHEILHSVVSVWEISIKHSLGQLPQPVSLDRFVVAQREMHGISVLPLVCHVHRLPHCIATRWIGCWSVRLLSTSVRCSHPIRSSFNTPSARSGNQRGPASIR